MSTKRFTPEKIKSLNDLKDKPIFVFGSNIQGEHVGGAALFALREFRANMHQGFGFQGASYAIPTCIRLTDAEGKRYTKPFDSVEPIKPYVEVFINDAENYPNLTFYVTNLCCGIAGFKVSEIAELFRPCLEMENVILPQEFVEWLLYPVVIANVKERNWESGKDYDDDTLMYYVMENIERKSIDNILDEFEKL